MTANSYQRDRTRGPRIPKLLFFAIALLLFALRQDFWLAADSRIVLGLPIGLLYHLGYCLLISAVLAFLVSRWNPEGRS